MGDADEIAYNFRCACGFTCTVRQGACAMHHRMQIQMTALAYEPILPMLQRHGADLFARLLSLSRSPEPARVPPPVRPGDAPSRTHIPSRQPYPSRQD